MQYFLYYLVCYQEYLHQKRHHDLQKVSGIRVVKSFVIEDKETEKFEKVSNSIFKDFSKGEKILALNNPLMQFPIYMYFSNIMVWS